MKKIIIAVFLTSFCLSIFSAPTLLWSKDIATLTDLSDFDVSAVYYCRGFPDGSVLMIIPPTVLAESMILLLDKDGNKLFETTAPVQSPALPDFAHSSDQFAVTTALSASNYIIRVYYKMESTYEYTEFSPINIKYSGDGGLLVNDVYTLSGSVLTKYSTEADAPTLVGTVSGMQNSNFHMSWDSRASVEYQIQESNNLTSSWTSVGSPLVGTGDVMSWSTPMISTSEFYRVILQ